MFLRDTAVLVAGAFAGLGLSPGEARAFPVRWGEALDLSQQEATYPIPAADGVTIDRTNQIIVVRFQNKIYAFSLACPHENTALRWLADENRFRCPRHESRYQPDGVFITGRATRNMDRLPIRRSGGNVVVDLVNMYRSDKDKAAWDTAAVAL
jgi:Rieske Fe-S protein